MMRILIQTVCVRAMGPACMGAIGVVTLCAGPLAAAPKITDDGVVQDFMLTSVLAAKVVTDCTDLAVSQQGLADLQTQVGTHITAQGYSAREAAALQSKRFNRQLERAAVRAIKDDGFDPDSAEGLCAYGESQMSKGTPVGAVLESR